MRATHNEHPPELFAVVPNHNAVWLLHSGDGVVAARRNSPSDDSSSCLASGLDGGSIERHFSPHPTPVSSFISLAAFGQPGMPGRVVANPRAAPRQRCGWRLGRGAPGRSRCSRRLMKLGTTTLLGWRGNIALTVSQRTVIAMWCVASVWLREPCVTRGEV